MPRRLLLLRAHLIGTIRSMRAGHDPEWHDIPNWMLGMLAVASFLIYVAAAFGWL